MNSVSGLWALLRDTRSRGQEQWFTPNRLARLRRERLRRLLETASRAPYYRDVFKAAGIAPGDLAREGILHHLPLLEKATLQQRGPELLTRPAASRNGWRMPFSIRSCRSTTSGWHRVENSRPSYRSAPRW